MKKYILVATILFLSGYQNLHALTSDSSEKTIIKENQESTKQDQQNSEDHTEQFPDINQESPNYIPIKWLKQNNIVHGYPDGTFKGERLINRAEALKIIQTAIKFNQFSNLERPINSSHEQDQTLNLEQEFPECNYPDVTRQDWFYPFVCKANQLEIVEGYPNGNFHPEKSINKVEALKMIIKQSGYPIPKNYQADLDNYADVNYKDWFFYFTHLAKQKTLYTETRSNLLYPEKQLKRADFSNLIYRAVKNGEQGNTFGKATYYADKFNGRNTASGEVFNNSKLTAAHLTLPFGTKVKVTNLKNGKSVEVVINDRGPFVKGNIIDLSKTAFEQISHLGAGIAYVELEIIE